MNKSQFGLLFSLILASSLRAQGVVSFGPQTQLVQNGLMAEYRMLPAESPSSLTDYSGNGRNATGTVGTAPTIISGSGGLACGGAGAVSLPASLNSALTIQVYVGYQRPNQSNNFVAPFFGNNFPNSIGLTLDATSGAFFSGGSPPVQIETWNTDAGNAFSYSNPSGVALLTAVLDTVDRIYVNTIDVTSYSPAASAGKQTAGNYQLCGATANPPVNYITGQLYYAVFYNRVLNPSELAQNYAFISSVMAARGVSPSLQSSDTGDLTLFEGDSITVGPSGTGTYTANLKLSGSWNIVNRARGGNGFRNFQPGDYQNIIVNESQTDGNYRPNAGKNNKVVWLGTNDIALGGASAPTVFTYLQSYARLYRSLGYKVGVATMISRTSFDSAKKLVQLLNPPAMADVCGLSH